MWPVEWRGAGQLGWSGAGLDGAPVSPPPVAQLGGRGPPSRDARGHQGAARLSGHTDGRAQRAGTPLPALSQCLAQAPSEGTEAPPPGGRCTGDIRAVALSPWGEPKGRGPRLEDPQLKPRSLRSGSETGGPGSICHRGSLPPECWSTLCVQGALGARLTWAAGSRLHRGGADGLPGRRVQAPLQIRH